MIAVAGLDVVPGEQRAAIQAGRLTINQTRNAAAPPTVLISPKAASCTACHDSPAAMGHVTSFGAATFANRTQAESLQVQEICADCHASGIGFKAVDIVHDQK